MRVNGFPRGDRLRKRSEFVSLSASGSKLRSTHFLILHDAGAGERQRLGITVSRKVGNAVIRNRIKRMVREFFRLNRHLFPQGRCNVIARQGADGLTSSELGRELARVLGRHSGRPC